MRRLVILAALVVATAAGAADTPRAFAPAGFAPIQSPCVEQGDGRCVAVSATMPLPVSGGGDATSANQAAQLAAEQEIRDRIGATTSPATGSTNQLIGATNALLAAPLAVTAPRGGSSIAAGQVSVGTTSTSVVAARSGRARVIVSIGASNACAIGAAGVTSSTGFALQPTAGATIMLETAAAVYAACSAATPVSFLEEY